MNDEGTASAATAATATVEQVFAAIACNRTQCSLDWDCYSTSKGCDGAAASNAAGLAAYGAHNYVALFEPLPTDGGPGRIVALLEGHKGRVNCVCFCPAAASGSGNSGGSTLLVSGSSDGVVIVWERTSDANGSSSSSDHAPFVEAARLVVSSESITCLAAARLEDDNRLCLFTGGGDHMVRCWEEKVVAVEKNGRKGEEEEGSVTVSAGGDASLSSSPSVSSSLSSSWTCVQTIDLGHHYALTLAATPAPEGAAASILAIGSDEDAVRLMVRTTSHGSGDSSGGAGGDSGNKWIPAAQLKGHEDWVQSVTFSAPLEDGSLLLASAGQDSMVRLWRVALAVDTTEPHATSESGQQQYMAAGSNISGGDGDAFARALRVSEQRFACGSGSSSDTGGADGAFCVVTAEAVLVGHDDKVFSARWHPVSTDDGSQPLALLTASMDKAMVLWKPEVESGVWTEAVRVGDVGGNIPGFYGGVFGPRGTHLLGHGFRGALTLWARADVAMTAGKEVATATAVGDSSTSQAGGSAGDMLAWRPCTVVGGHFAGVRDLVWAAGGEYLLSVSDDQTTRVWAPWTTRSSADGSGNGISWHEIARPQVHGYDMRCVCALGPLVFASGADEKVVRIFEAPATFTASFGALTGQSLAAEEQDGLKADAPPSSATASSSTPVTGAALGANVPALGLSNKAVYDLKEAARVQAGNSYGPNEAETLPFAPAVLSEPPLEGHLVQNTLWPERQKLYGHGYELLCVAANHTGTLLASACRATTPEHASILLWDAATWRRVGALPGHKLSVTQLSFSPDDMWLASSSRDRQLCVFRRVDTKNAPAPSGDQGDGGGGDNRGERTLPSYELYTCVPRAHARISWSLAWAPDSTAFATASRDKMVKVWRRNSPDGAWCLHSSLPKQVDSVTAIDWAPSTPGSDDAHHLIAIGLDSGSIAVYCSSISSDSGSGDSGGDGGATTWNEVLRLPPGMRHTSTVRRVQWRGGGSGAGSYTDTTAPGGGDRFLATAGMDGAVKVFRVRL